MRDILAEDFFAVVRGFLSVPTPERKWWLAHWVKTAEGVADAYDTCARPDPRYGRGTIAEIVPRKRPLTPISFADARVLDAIEDAGRLLKEIISNRT